jgi:hypothetical protein
VGWSCVDGTSGDATAARSVAVLVQRSNVASSIAIARDRNSWYRSRARSIGGNGTCWSVVDGTSRDATAARSIAVLVQHSNVGSKIVIAAWTRVARVVGTRVGGTIGVRAMIGARIGARI